MFGGRVLQAQETRNTKALEGEKCGSSRMKEKSCTPTTSFKDVKGI